MIDRESLVNPAVELPFERPRLAALCSHAQGKLREALDRLDARERRWLESTPLDQAVEVVSRWKPLSDYFDPPPRGFAQLQQTIEAAGGDPWKLVYSRLLLWALIARLPGATLPLRVPSILWEQVEDGLDPFVEEVASLGATDWSDEDFLKDLAVAQLRMLPNEGIALTLVRLHPWYLMSHARWRERVAVSRYLGLRTISKARPYVTGHAWRGFKEGRDLPQWRRVARQVALVAANPEVGAYLRAGWNDDPVLATISPYVYERSKLYVALGGRRFRMASSPDVVQMATTSSKTRRRLYEEGSYLPTTYGVFVKRADFLRWADTADVQDEAEPDP